MGLTRKGVQTRIKRHGKNTFRNAGRKGGRTTANRYFGKKWK